MRTMSLSLQSAHPPTRSSYYCAFHLNQDMFLHSRSHSKSFGQSKSAVNSGPLSGMKMQIRESFASVARRKIGVGIISLFAVYGLSASPEWIEGIQRGWQVYTIDRQSTGEGVQEAIGILRKKFALLQLSEIDARLKSVSENSDKDIFISDILQRLEDKYSRIASPRELASLLKFDPSGTGVVLRQGLDGGIYLSHASKREDVQEMRVFSIAGEAVASLYDAAELLIEHEKPLEIVLTGSALGNKGQERTRILVDVQDEFKRLEEQGGSVHAALVKVGARSIGYIRIKQFDAFVGNKVPAPHPPPHLARRASALRLKGPSSQPTGPGPANEPPAPREASHGPIRSGPAPSPQPAAPGGRAVSRSMV
jgi:hypothetical protein